MKKSLLQSFYAGSFNILALALIDQALAVQDSDSLDVGSSSSSQSATSPLPVTSQSEGIPTVSDLFEAGAISQAGKKYSPNATLLERARYHDTEAISELARNHFERNQYLESFKWVQIAYGCGTFLGLREKDKQTLQYILKELEKISSTFKKSAKAKNSVHKKNYLKTRDEMKIISSGCRAVRERDRIKVWNGVLSLGNGREWTYLTPLLNIVNASVKPDSLYRYNFSAFCTLAAQKQSSIGESYRSEIYESAFKLLSCGIRPINGREEDSLRAGSVLKKSHENEALEELIEDFVTRSNTKRLYFLYGLYCDEGKLGTHLKNKDRLARAIKYYRKCGSAESLMKAAEIYSMDESPLNESTDERYRTAKTCVTLSCSLAGDNRNYAHFGFYHVDGFRALEMDLSERIEKFEYYLKKSKPKSLDHVTDPAFSAYVSDFHLYKLHYYRALASQTKEDFWSHLDEVEKLYKKATEPTEHLRIMREIREIKAEYTKFFDERFSTSKHARDSSSTTAVSNTTDLIDSDDSNLSSDSDSHSQKFLVTHTDSDSNEKNELEVPILPEGVNSEDYIHEAVEQVSDGLDLNDESMKVTPSNHSMSDKQKLTAKEKKSKKQANAAKRRQEERNSELEKETPQRKLKKLKNKLWRSLTTTTNPDNKKWTFVNADKVKDHWGEKLIQPILDDIALSPWELFGKGKPEILRHLRKKYGVAVYTRRITHDDRFAYIPDGTSREIQILTWDGHMDNLEKSIQEYLQSKE